MRLHIAFLAVLVFAGMVFADYPNLPVYNQIIDLGTLGGDRSEAWAVNEHGQVVGWSETETGSSRAFIWDNNVMTELPPSGGTDSYAKGINDSGKVVGEETIEPGQYNRNACFWFGGEFTALPTIGNYWHSCAYGINESGYIVGYTAEYTDSGADRNACLWKPPEPNGLIRTIDLGTLGGQPYQESYAYAINDANQVVGRSYTLPNGDNRAFLWENGIMKGIGTLGGRESIAYDINNSGCIVGMSYIGGYQSPIRHAFLRDPNGPPDSNGAPTAIRTDLNAPEDTYGYAYGINESLQVVGRASTSGESYYAFLWTEEYGMVDLNELLPQGSGWTLNSAKDISNNSEIVGYGKKAGKTHGFIMIPESLVKHTLTIQANPANADSITPAAGEYEYYEGRYADISAEPFANCDVDKSQYDFARWDGAVVDANSASTEVLMDGGKTITAVLAAIPKECGDLCHPIQSPDLNGDCHINLADFAIFCEGYLDCTHPDCD